MPLPKLTWKMLPTIQLYPFSQSTSNPQGYLDGIFNLFNSNVYADGSSRVTGSGLAWTFFRTSSVDSGSTKGVTAVVYGYPPTMSVISQSVIFAGSSSVPTTTPLVGNTQTYTANHIYVAIQKYANPLQYRSWISASVFNSGSSGLNTISSSGYQTAFSNNLSSNGYVQGWECQEAIVVSFSTTSSAISTTTANTSLIFAGAIFDPETSSNPNNIFAEQDGRLYGVIGNGRTGGITDRFPINGVQILNINGSLGTVSHVSLPGANNGGLGDTALLKIHARDTSMTEYSRPDGDILVYPIYLSNNYIRFVGRLREIYAYPSKKIHGTVINDGIRDIGYTIGSTNVCAQDCYFLRAI